MSKQKWTDQEFIEAVKTSLSYAEVMRKLQLVPSGGNYDVVKRAIKRLNLDTSHMTGQGWNVGIRYKQIRAPMSLTDILVEDSKWVFNSKLKQRLINAQYKEYKCECCGNTEWMGKPIPLEIHHINGVKQDLRIENLQLLCPNCHAFTDNYRGKSKVQSAQEETLDVEVG